MIPALKVPFLTERQLENAAADVLLRYAKWRGAPPRPPIPVDHIVEGLLELSLSVGDLRARLGNDDVLGATWLEDGHVMIDSSLEGNEGRFSFTLAHETGHWILHKPIIEMDRVTVPRRAREPDAEPAPDIVCRGGQKREAAESQADSFAASLLMPASEVRAAAKRVSDQPLALDCLKECRTSGEGSSKLRAFAAEVMERGNFSNVSNRAMQIRLVALKQVVGASALERSLR